MIYSDLNFLDFIPRFMRAAGDNSGLAAGLTAFLKIRAAAIKNLNCFEFVNDLTEAEIDFLAECFDIFYFRQDWTLAEKKACINGWDGMRALAGTKGALEQILKLYFNDSSIIIEEWFDYNGEPYHFRIYANSSDVQAFLPVLFAKAKRTSQILDGVYIGIKPLCFYNVGLGIYADTQAEKGETTYDSSLYYYYCLPPAAHVANAINSLRIVRYMTGLGLIEARDIWQAWYQNSTNYNTFYFPFFWVFKNPRYVAAKCLKSLVDSTRADYPSYANGGLWGDVSPYNQNDLIPVLDRRLIFGVYQ